MQFQDAQLYTVYSDQVQKHKFSEAILQLHGMNRFWYYPKNFVLLKIVLFSLSTVISNMGCLGEEITFYRFKMI